ncbi:MAG TPA: hypothetical protein PK095_04945 [Myxococcota bacterium]|nr:hypothetical protein [Myxococcota bacterium]
MTVAPLGLVGVGEVVWDLEVLDGEGQVVWQRRLSASRYGARGGLSYVGPCNAQAPNHSVRLWVAGLFEEPVAEVGAFGSGSDLAGSLEYIDPTALGPLVQPATCVDNGDTPVRFDVAVMRPANQGFFDVAVTFEDIFCSAKFDCCGDENGDGVCALDGAEDHLLLFDGDGQRASTMVLGFACTAGVGEGATELYLDPLWLDCTTGEGAFSVDIAVTPGGAPGNQCEVGPDGGLEQLLGLADHPGARLQPVVQQHRGRLQRQRHPDLFSRHLDPEQHELRRCWLHTRLDPMVRRLSLRMDDSTVHGAGDVGVVQHREWLPASIPELLLNSHL